MERGPERCPGRGVAEGTGGGGGAERTAGVEHGGRGEVGSTCSNTEQALSRYAEQEGGGCGPHAAGSRRDQGREGRMRNTRFRER